ncbi:SPRY domain-containing SOCS box protein 3 isoform X2 [Esox lucius]|uniref:SPRY domain-containing SOCS box protein 3 isoform X2 n=1 Tax=Esox lucius TaxID=8010 RepID=UPI0014773A70|nr:SPRY domain-containing SOCS box protein 3 isoform X2 [Esox lucius]
MKVGSRVAMLRRNRNSRAHHYARCEIWRGDDTMAMVLANEREVWGDERTQISDSDSEEDYLAISPEVTDAVPDTVPVTGESYCHCDHQEEPSSGAQLQVSKPFNDCLCGEEDQGFDWVWDEGVKSNAAFLSCDNRKVSFHSEYSCGTAAIRGTKELADGQHFWEIKMTSPVYGTDMMVGVGTSEVNLDKFKHSFCSMLGTDEDSWGLSYTGILQHKGEKVNFSSRFGQGSIIGLHLDTWHGTLTFYKNRRCIGVAATRLQNKKLYPMVCSTAAKSSMKVIRACYTPTSLQYLCCSRLGQQWSDCPVNLNTLPIPPGLRHLLHNQMGWVFTLNNGAPDQSEDSVDESDEDLVKDLKKDLVEDIKKGLVEDVKKDSADNLPDGLAEDLVDDLLDVFPVEYSGDLSDESHEEGSPCTSPCLSPTSTLSACSSPSPVPNPQPCQCPPLQPSAQPCSCSSLCPCPTSPPGSKLDCEEFQRKRCRWV